MTGRFDRRAFLGAAAGAGALALLGDARGAVEAAQAIGRRPGPAPFARDGKFGHGVASGHPGPRAISLWTRVDELERTSSLRLEVAADPEFKRVVHRQVVRAAAVRDYTVHARLGGGPLKPGEQYFYRFFTRNQTSPVGRFRTARPPDSRQPVRVGFFSCQDWQSGYYTAHAGLAAEPDLDLVVCLGDYIYERNFFDGPRRDDLGANRDGEVQTLDEYRAKYRLYRSDPNLQAMHQAHPAIAIWDDHEVEDNYTADKPGEQTSDPRVSFAERRRAAYLAFFENMPQARIRPERNRIYRRLSLGRHADLFLLDERQYRDDQPCNDRLIAPPCPEAEQPGRKLLGTAQKEWLKRELERSRATWKLIANQVMIMALDFPQGNPIFLDGWDGYAAERRELMGHVRDRRIENVSFLTGDIHAFFAGQVTESGREPGQPLATEFAGGSITSLTIPEFLATSSGGPAATQATERVEQFNPHIAYQDQNSYGYAIAEARQGELLVDLRSPETTRQPRSRMRTLSRLRVRAGVPRVEVT